MKLRERARAAIEVPVRAAVEPVVLLALIGLAVALFALLVALAALRAWRESV